MRIALCISGQMRTYRECFASHDRNLLQPLAPDVFIHTWSNTGASWKDADRYGGTDLDDEDLRRRYNPRELISETFTRGLNEHYRGVSVPEALRYAEPQIYKSTIPLFYKIHQCNELKKGVEKKEGRYDVVIRLRPDLMLLDTPKIRKIEEGVLYFNRYALDTRYQVSDKFLYGDSSTMDAFASLWQLLNHYWRYPLGNYGWESHRVGERLAYHHVNHGVCLPNTATSERCYIRRIASDNNPYTLKAKTARYFNKFRGYFQ